MPLIRGIVVFADRVEYISGTGQVKTFDYSRIPQTVVNQGAAAVEAWCVDFLEDPVNDLAFDPNGTRRFYIAVHVVTLEPDIILQSTVSDVPITGTWWAGRTF